MPDFPETDDQFSLLISGCVSLRCLRDCYVLTSAWKGAMRSLVLFCGTAPIPNQLPKHRNTFTWILGSDWQLSRHASCKHKHTNWRYFQTIDKGNGNIFTSTLNITEFNAQSLFSWGSEMVVHTRHYKWPKNVIQVKLIVEANRCCKMLLLVVTYLYVGFDCTSQTKTLL